MKRTVLAALLTLAPLSAHAAPPGCTATTEGVSASATEALALWRAWDYERFRLLSDLLSQQLACLGSVVPPAAAADIHLVLGLRVALDAPGEEVPAAAAASFHAWRVLTGEGEVPAEIAAKGSKYHRALTIPLAAPPTRAPRLPRPGEWWVDGTPTAALPPRAAIVQHQPSKRPLRTLYVDGSAEKPSRLRPPHPGRGLAIAAAGAAAVAAGSGAIALSAYRDFIENPSSTTADPLFSRNQNASLIATSAAGAALGLTAGAVVVRWR